MRRGGGPPPSALCKRDLRKKDGLKSEKGKWKVKREKGKWKGTGSFKKGTGSFKKGTGSFKKGTGSFKEKGLVLSKGKKGIGS